MQALCPLLKDSLHRLAEKTFKFSILIPAGQEEGIPAARELLDACLKATIGFLVVVPALAEIFEDVRGVDNLQAAPCSLGCADSLKNPVKD